MKLCGLGLSLDHWIEINIVFITVLCWPLSFVLFLLVRSAVTVGPSIYIIKGDMFVCLFVCHDLCSVYGRPNGWADRDQT